MTKTLEERMAKLKELANQKTTKELADVEYWLIKGESDTAKEALEIMAEKETEEQIVYLVAIIQKNTEYEDVKNYLFKNRNDAINLIEKYYCLKPVKNSPRIWQYDNINAVLTELFLRSRI